MTKFLSKYPKKNQVKKKHSPEEMHII